MKRTLISVVVLLAMVIAASAVFAGRPIVVRQKPKIAVLPVFVTTNNDELYDAIDNLTLDYLAQINFKVITGAPVQQAAEDLGIRLAPHSSQFGGSRSPSGGWRFRPAGATVVLDDENLLRIGRYLKTNFVLGAGFEIHEKPTWHISGSRLNGRCKPHLKVLDVERAEVLYEYPVPGGKAEEFGVSNHESWKDISSGLGFLAATGIIGKGHATRNLGWAMLIAPHVIHGGPGDQLQYDATAQAVNVVFGDFYSRFLDSSYKH